MAHRLPVKPPLPGCVAWQRQPPPVMHASRNRNHFDQAGKHGSRLVLASHNRRNQGIAQSSQHRHAQSAMLFPAHAIHDEFPAARRPQPGQSRLLRPAPVGHPESRHRQRNVPVQPEYSIFAPYPTVPAPRHAAPGHGRHTELGLPVFSAMLEHHFSATREKNRPQGLESKRVEIRHRSVGVLQTALAKRETTVCQRSQIPRFEPNVEKLARS